MTDDFDDLLTKAEDLRDAVFSYLTENKIKNEQLRRHLNELIEDLEDARPDE